MGDNLFSTNRKMGISRDTRHKRRLTGGRMPIHKKKRKFESGKPPAMTKLMAKRIRLVRTRGGSFKKRALRLNIANFNWQSEACTRKSKIVNVIYNPVSNELVRTNTLTKGTIVFIDATPFQKYIYAHYYGIWKVKDGEKMNKFSWETKEENPDFKYDKSSKDAKHKLLHRRLNNTLEQKVQDQLAKGSILARITSRPGQSGRADGVILEGKELDFYLKKLPKKRM